MNRTFALVVGMAAVYSLLFVMAQMHRMGGAVIAPALSLELSLSASDLGLIIGTMFLASAATQPISGILLDRFGRSARWPICRRWRLAACCCSHGAIR